jgi:hypothetical protein
MSARFLKLVFLGSALCGALLSPVPATAQDSFSLQLDEGYVFQQDYNRQLRLALWESPLGRLEHQLSQQRRSLGLQGLPDEGGGGFLAARFKLQAGLPVQLVLDNGWVQSWHDVPADSTFQRVAKGAVALGTAAAIIKALK